MYLHMGNIYVIYGFYVFFEDLLRPPQLEKQYTILKLIIGILRINRHKQTVTNVWMSATVGHT
ncbi:hypothetical protein M513_13519 [Trichuris suis]|uniref:Uncharacterized protein n=1 Tax=Trichuris suis TaxID=68888 RepID=A0A085LKV9_9BILA|nr:hypothetical protein M513_13519 [Trichuris suis]